MNALISVISIILFIVLGIIIYNGLNGMDLKKKIIIFIFEIIVCLIFTMILFNISSLGIEYPNSQSREIALKILVTIFTPMNGIILLPNITRLINESQNGEIDKEECARKLNLPHIWSKYGPRPSFCPGTCCRYCTRIAGQHRPQKNSYSLCCPAAGH